MNNTNATYFLNRAKSHKALRNFTQMYKDSLTAIEMDDQYIKAFIHNGEALVMLGKEARDVAKIDKGIGRLQKAEQLCYKHKEKGFLPLIAEQIH